MEGANGMAVKLKVDKGIPIPPRQRSKWADLLKKMAVGDSFMVQSCGERDCALRANCCKHGIKVVSRKINGEGYRIWRTK